MNIEHIHQMIDYAFKVQEADETSREIVKTLALGGKAIIISTFNSITDGHGSLIRQIITDDGWWVTWARNDIGVPTGEDFLPQEWFDLPWRLIS